MKSRLKAIMISSAHLLAGFMGIAFAEANDVQWYSQSVNASRVPGIYEVIFEGVVTEGTSIAVDPEKILIIQHKSRIAKFALPLTLDQYLMAYRSDWLHKKQGVFQIRSGCHIFKKPEASAPKIPASGLEPLWMAREAGDWYSVESPVGELAYLPQSCLVFRRWSLSTRDAARVLESGDRVRLTLHLPAGMIQLPVAIARKGGEPKTVLYNVQISPQGVESNIPLVPRPKPVVAKKAPHATSRTSRKPVPSPSTSSKKHEMSHPPAIPSEPSGVTEGSPEANRWMMKGGLGFSRFEYSQDIDGTDKLIFEKTAVPAIRLEAALRISKFVIRGSYDHTGASADVADPYSLVSDKYNWNALELAVAYPLKSQPSENGWWGELLYNQTQLPFLDLLGGDRIEIRTLSYQALGFRLRGRAELASLQWTGSFGAQIPLSASTGDFDEEDFQASLIWNLEFGIEYIWSQSSNVGILTGYRPHQFDYEVEKDSGTESGTIHSTSIPFWLTFKHSF